MPHPPHDPGSRLTRRTLLFWSLALTLGCQPDYGRFEHKLARFEGTALPVVVIDTDGERIRDEPKRAATMQVFAEGVGDLVALGTESPAFSGSIGIEVRGYTSQEFPKKQYGLELREADGSELNESLLGMPAESDWVLSAPFMDKSLLRNHFGYGLARALGRYAPRTRFVELFLNQDGADEIGTKHYRGVYVLTERIKRDPARVNIEKLGGGDDREPEIAGGYLLEWTLAERVKRTERSFRTPGGVTLVVAYPKPDELSDRQLRWISEYVATLEQSLDDEDEGYEQYMDVPSFIDHILLNELLRNHDAFTASTFLFKSREGKLAMGPLWDLDRTLGDVEFGGNWKTAGFLLPQRGWAKRLLTRARFVRSYQERWRELRQDALSTPRMLAMIDQAVMELGDAPKRNFEKWQVLGEYVKANVAPYSDSFEEEIQKIKTWLTQRAAWMDDHIDELGSI
jgi:hypothetical protein